MQNSDDGAGGIFVEPLVLKNTSIILDDIATEEAQQLENAVRFVIERYGRDLNLTGLMEVIVTGSYQDTLRRIGKRDNREINRTNNELGLGVAKAHRVYENGDLRHSIIIDHSSARYLLSEDDNEFAFGCHVIHHELWHVDDANRLLESRTVGWLEKMPNYKTTILTSISVTVWEEYYANRKAARTTLLQGNALINHLITAATQAHEFIRQAMIAYRTDSNLNIFLSSALSYTSTIVTASAYVIGYLDAARDLDTPFDEVEASIEAALNELQFGNTWRDLAKNVRTLSQDYPNWGSILEAMAPISTTIERLLLEYNIILHDQGDSVYVELPLTPETCPSWPPPGW